MECAELMVSANNITVAYAEAMRVEGKKLRELSGMTQEKMSKMERKMGNLQEQYKMVEQTYG